MFQISETRVEVGLGALDDVPSGLEPRQEGWIKRREHWTGDSPAQVRAFEDP